jgi:tRNA/rRNA methyltransferase
MPTVRAPIVVLVEPQLGENIGMVARAMANMGLTEMRLVKPRDGWPSEKAVAASAGADAIVTGATLHETPAAAISDCHYAYASTARQHAQAKQVVGPREAARSARARITAGQSVAILFGRERIGLLADELALADAVLTLPVNPDFPSLNLAQAVLLAGYEWLLSAGEEGELLPYVTDLGSPPATREEAIGLMEHLESELDAAGFFQPVHKKDVMTRNLRNILHRRSLTAQDVRTLHGVVTSLVRGPRRSAS